MPAAELQSTTMEGFCQELDPGAVGPNYFWFQPSNGNLKIRGSQNDSWISAGSAGGGGSGTVTNIPGALTLNQLVIGNGSNDVKVAAAITANMALISNGSGIPIASVVTAAELAFVSGVTSGIQGQLNVLTAAVAGIGSPSFATLAGGTNTSAAMVVGTGASLATSGSGTIVATSLSATLPATGGGTGQTTYVIGDLLYANTTTTLARLAAVAAGSYLRSTGTSSGPVYSTVTYSNAAVTGDIIAATGTNTYGNIAAVATGQVLTSAGTGTLPVWSASVGALTFSTITITQGTIAADAPQLTGTVTWNNAAIVGPAWKLVVTDTASNAAALLMDLQVTAGTSKWNVDKTGKVTQTGVLTFNPSAAGNQIAFKVNTIAARWAIATVTGQNYLRFLSDGADDFRLEYLGGGLSFSSDTILRRVSAAVWAMGAVDVNGAAVAQTLQVQSAITGTDQNGGNWTFIGSKQTGAGTPGNIIFQTAIKLGSGTTQGSVATGLTITGAIASMQPSVLVGNQALATTATEGFLYIPTCAGAPTGVPTARTGLAPMILDTTNNKFYMYNAAWKGVTIA